MKNMKNYGNNEEITGIKNHFTYLKLGDIDPELNAFVEDNFKFFMQSRSKKGTRKEILGNQRGFILHRNGSSFKILFIPNYVNPDYVQIELVNLSSHLEQTYNIDFASEDSNSIIITYRKRFKSLLDKDLEASSTTKVAIETVYINGKKRYKRHFEHFVGKSIYEDSSFSKEEKICYSTIDDSYVRSYVAVAEPNAYVHTAMEYEKYDGKEVIPISAAAFSNEVVKFSEEKAKVFEIRKDN